MDSFNFESSVVKFVGVAEKGATLVAVFKRCGDTSRDNAEMFVLTKHQLEKRAARARKGEYNHGETKKAIEALVIRPS